MPSLPGKATLTFIPCPFEISEKLTVLGQQ